MILLLLQLACLAPHRRELGSTGLSAELSTGMGGLIGPGAAGADDPVWQARVREAWARFDATTPAFSALVAPPARRWSTDEQDLRRLLADVSAMEAALGEVLRVGAAAPAVAALARLGQVYEAVGAWLQSEVTVEARYKTRRYRLIYGALHPLGVRLPAPWRPIDPGAALALRLCDGCGEEPIWTTRAKQAYRMAVEKGWETGLHGDAALLFALSRLQVLDPEEFPKIEEQLPGLALPTPAGGL